MKFSIKDFFRKCDKCVKIHRTSNLVTFTREILNEKLLFFFQWRIAIINYKQKLSLFSQDDTRQAKSLIFIVVPKAEQQNRTFINSLLSFHKENKLKSTFLNNDNTYIKVLIQNIRCKTKNRKHRSEKVVFQKNRQKIQTDINLFELNNDHTQIIRKIQFRSSFNSQLIRISQLICKFDFYALLLQNNNQ